MKKLFLTMLVVFFLTLSSLAHAWHLEYTFDGDMYYEDNLAQTYLHASADVFVEERSFWEVTDAYNDAGGVTVEYDTDWAMYASYGIGGYAEFQIVSDYGNMAQIPILASIAGESDIEVMVGRMGHNYGLDGYAYAESEVFHNMSTEEDLYAEAEIQSWGEEGDHDDVEENIMLFANTLYFFNCSLFTEVDTTVELPPTWFESWEAYNLFFDGEKFGEVWTNAFAGLWFEINIDGTEQPVPVPGTILLLGSGLIGLVGFRRKIKRCCYSTFEKRNRC